MLPSPFPVATPTSPDDKPPLRLVWNRDAARRTAYSPFERVLAALLHRETGCGFLPDEVMETDPSAGHFL
jgi:hypothetical protein